ncbi:hypothetical protein HanRHA438_Chr16g0787161 [Helianthus annuus]|nr:hypothetical protein HanRHA438_Chr16g0787161 [Helianthus annuus]
MPTASRHCPTCNKVAVHPCMSIPALASLFRRNSLGLIPIRLSMLQVVHHWNSLHNRS